MIALIVLFYGCTKKTEPTLTTTNTSQNDQTGSTEADDALSDVNSYISNKIGGGSNARVAAYNLPCGVVGVDSTIDSATGIKTYNMYYGNQTPCGYKYKSGQISFALQNGTAFNNANAVFSIKFTNYSVEVKATGSTVTLSGTIYVTNINGGYIWQAVTASKTITHKLRGTINITYANNVTRPKNYFQRRTWVSSNGDWTGLSFSVAGDTAVGTYTNVFETGLTYDGGYTYNTQLITPFTWSNCGVTYAGPYVLEVGEAKMNITGLSVTAYIDIKAGYYVNYKNSQSTPSPSNDCLTNAYQITLEYGSKTSTSYQLY